MAYENVLTTITLQSSQDMSGYQYRFVGLSTLGYCSPTTAAARLAGGVGQAVGILQDKTTAVYGPCKVAISGISKLYCGDSSGTEAAGVLSYGTRITPSSGSTGHGIAAVAAGSQITAFSLGAGPTSGAMGIIPVRITCLGLAGT